ncbi:hypothetical protein AOLI_G00231230 [Acnodon oligacanthus]
MDPAELDPIKSALQNQGAVIGRHVQLLHNMMQQLTLLVRAQTEGAQPASATGPPPSGDLPEPMQLGGVGLPDLTALGLMPSRPDTLATPVAQWETPGPSPAFIDSGAVESFLDVTLATDLGLPFQPLEHPLPVMAINSHSLGLRQHNPHIDWSTQSVCAWGLQCDGHCQADPCPPHGAPSSMGPIRLDVTGVPKGNWDLKQDFSKEEAQVLQPHREFDCTINLLPGATPPHSQLFMLSLPEWHNNQAHEKIRHSQREDEQVGGSVELLEVRDGDDHQQVQEHSAHRNT